VFYETRGTTAGVIVADDSSDLGLLHVNPVAVNADHVDICKPADDGNLVYARTRDFIADEIVPGETSDAAFGSLRRLDLPPLPRSRSRSLAPVVVRLAVLLIVGLIAFKGVQALLFPPDLLSAATVEWIEAAVKTLGQILGIGGVALGVFFLLFRELIRKSIFPMLKKDDAYRLLRLISVLVWSVAVIGLAAWDLGQSNSASTFGHNDGRSKSRHPGYEGECADRL
jgi:hypothetical protein